MEHDKAYLQPKIKIADIANILNERAHQLSKVINQHYGMNFFHFVNRYRVEYAMTLLAAPENAKLTIEGIGLQAGFSTRATFNSRFKEYTGKSPGVYMKEMQG